VCFVTEPVKIRLVLELHVSFVKGKDIITAKAIHNVRNAKVRENQVIDFHVRVAEEKDLINNKFFQMNNVGDNIRESLQKRIDATAKQNARRLEFVKTRERIIADIEEARKIWKDTMAQLPKTEFQEF
jgi:hypothetical protein